MDLESSVDAGECNPCGNYMYCCTHEEMNPRRRSTMEDVHRVVPYLAGSNEYSYFGVYDGHGGRHIVDFLEETLENNISTELQLPDEASVLERIRRAFLITDMQSKQLDIVTSGATAVVALLKTTCDETTGTVTAKDLYVANVGDSRAVIMVPNKVLGGSGAGGVTGNGDDTNATNGGGNTNESSAQNDSSGNQKKKSAKNYTAMRLTYDHRAEDEEEQDRITRAGGFINRGRVLGILAVTRSFGDHGMKDFVCADPYMTHTNLVERRGGVNNEEEVPLLILACDGVWDVLTDQEAGELILEHYFRIGAPFQDAGKLLVQEAIQRGSGDNVTAIVIFL